MMAPRVPHSGPVKLPEVSQVRPAMLLNMLMFISYIIHITKYATPTHNLQVVLRAYLYQKRELINTCQTEKQACKSHYFSFPQNILTFERWQHFHRAKYLLHENLEVLE